MASLLSISSYLTIQLYLSMNIHLCEGPQRELFSFHSTNLNHTILKSKTFLQVRSERIDQIVNLDTLELSYRF